MTAQAAMAPGRAADGGTVATNAGETLQELGRALARETATVNDLREALLRQRAGVAADSAADVHGSCDDIARVLGALDAARRHRATLLQVLAPEAPPTLEGLEAALGGGLPPELGAARAALRAAAERAAHEAAVNRTVLQRTVEAGEAFLQALFSGGAPQPVYRPGERREDEGAGHLLDRKA